MAARPSRRPVRAGLSRAVGYVLMVLVVLVAVVPLLLMLRVALTPAADWRSMPIDWFRAPFTGSFSQVLSDGFLGTLLNSFIIAVVTTVAVVLLSAIAGHALARMRSRHKENFLFFVLGTRMGPAVVFALPLYLLATKVQLVDTYVGIILVYIVYNLAFGIWMMHGFFLDVPAEVEEAGLMDGLSEWGVFWRVSLRMVVPGLIATATLVFILTWNEFFYAFVLTREDANPFTTTIPGYFGAFQVDWGQMFAASVLGVLPPVIFGVLVRRWLARGLSGGLVE
ncbi:carbohydrate ABC transporter permease [Blastococcus atacamensis]|uniref:carbohydrate ABC transporter permease n=1 Tax=Blastococcus atacamensis TaxID=2070508 RepID=UPI000CEBC9BC|nr:carbohydrate ABC transporter permease [Blastococcus atacamensis]